MKRILLPFAFMVASAALAGDVNPHQRQYNFVSFSLHEKNFNHELDALTPYLFKMHPEYGLLPYNSPCENCIELKDHRDATSRYFVEKGSGGKRFYKQQSYGAINYLDPSGWWREINYRLKPKSGKIFEATDQPSPVTINVLEKFSSIKNQDQEILFNKNLVLYHLDQNGKAVTLGEPDWSHVSAGDDGILVKDFYHGIDLQMIVMEGSLKTNFILSNAPAFSGGWLVMKQKFEFTGGLAFQPEETKRDGNNHFGGDILIGDQQHEYFRIHSSIAFDANNQPHIIPLMNDFNEGNELFTYIPMQWLNDPQTVYPVVIDPLVSTTGVLPQASITGSQYNALCWSGGCQYYLSVATPANCRIIDIMADFSYLALGSCVMPDGGISFDYLSCRSPDSAAYNCSLPAPGNCGLTFLSLALDTPFFLCVPPPQCSPYNMDFTMNFYRCNMAGPGGCDATCIAAASPWSMTIKGETVQIKPGSLTPNQLICEGDTATLYVSAQNGVPGYSYLWTPSGLTNDTVRVSPASTTVYYIQVTDTCGVSVLDSSTVNVVPNNNPGFTISPDPQCIGQNVTITGNGAGPPANYDWLLTGSNNPVVNNSQSTVTQYPVQGTYTVTLNYPNGTCVFPDTQTVTINNYVTPSVTVNASPAGAVCTGTTVVFTAIPVNGGTAPAYQWQVNGVNTGTSSDTFSVALTGSSTISVVMTSNFSCLSAPTANGQLIVSVISSVTPTVNITSNPSFPICTGTNTLFTATPVFGGSTPTYQWQLNGVNVGTNTDTFSISTLSNGDVIGVTMTSNFGCVSTVTATDTVLAVIVSNVIPAVSISANPGLTFCTGMNVTFTANPVNGGSVPTYQWYLNGAPAGTGNTFSSSTLNNQDTIAVVMTSGFPCASPPADSSSEIVTVLSSIVPSVSIVANPPGSNCAGTMIHFTAMATNGGTLPSYQWLLNGVPIAGAVNDTFSVSTLNNGDVMGVVMTSNLNCATPVTGADTVIMNVIPNVTPAVSINVIPNDTACAGDSIQFNALPQNEGTSPVYQWSVNGVTTGTNSPVFSSSVLNDGDVITVSLASNALCASPVNANSTPVAITINPVLIPSVSITSTPPDTICAGSGVVLNASAVNGGTNPSYQWDVNGIAVGGNVSSLTSTTFIQGDAVTVQMTSNETCVAPRTVASNTIIIQTYPAILANATGNATVCPKVSTLLQVTASGGTGGPYQYSWSHVAGTGSTVNVSPVTTTNYVVSVTDACAGIPATASVLITVLPAPAALYSYNPLDPSSYHPEVTFSDLSSDAINWWWNFGDGDTTAIQNPVHTFPDAGMYDVSLAVMNALGCFDTVTFRIVVKENIALFVPNTFTPNGDGRNETFAPMGLSLKDFEMVIYDRWGNEIFKGGPLNAWTGTINSSKTPAPDGIYIYRIDLKDAKFEKQIITGSVRLIR